MEINEIMKKLKHFSNGFPKETLSQAIERRDEIIPLLLNEIEWAIENINILQEEETNSGYYFAFFLLAQFKEKRAFPLIVEFFTQLKEDPYYFTGDLITENLDQILASVYDGNLKLIKNVIENRNVNEFIRSAFMESLLVLYKYDDLKRNELISYFRSLFNEKLEREYSYIWQILVSCCAEIFADDLKSEIRQSYNNGLINVFELPQDEVFSAIDEKHYDYSNFENRKKILNIIEEAETWVYYDKEFTEEDYFDDSDDFDDSNHQRTLDLLENNSPQINDNVFPDEKMTYKRKTKKIGRNEPCPCSSGKKYKKCCGKIVLFLESLT